MDLVPHGIFHRPSSSRRIARALLVTILIALNLAGCRSLYLHSDETKQATANAKAELDKVNLATVFDSEAAYLDSLEHDENVAVAESLGAQRDRAMLTMLRGSRGGRDTRMLMSGRIDGYLKGLAGTSDGGAGKKLWRLMDDARERVSATKPLAKALSEVLASDRGQIRERPGVTELLSPSGTTLEQAMADSQNAIDQRIQNKKQAEEAQKALKADLEAAAKSLSAGTATQETFTKLLARFNELLGKAKTEANPYIGVLVSESLVEELDELIELTDPKDIDQPADSKARAAIGFVHAAFGVGDAFSNPPRVPHPNALAVAQAWLKYTASQASADLAEAQARETAIHARLAAVTEQVYYLSRAGEELANISTNPPLAEGAGFSRLLASNNTPTKTSATATLHYFTSAWNKGFIPAQQLNQVALPLIERRAKLQRSRLAADAWMGALKPSVATLVAYGEGGIDPHLIAELFQALGITGIAVGVN